MGKFVKFADKKCYIYNINEFSLNAGSLSINFTIKRIKHC